MSSVEDENVQRRGIVGLGYSVGNVVGWSSDYEMVRRIVNLLNSVPARFLAIYTCFNSRRIETVVDVVVHMFNAFLRARFRAFLGKLIFEALGSSVVIFNMFSPSHTTLC
jgi:hypothetical protein